jgi:hypothetical protein
VEEKEVRRTDAAARKVKREEMAKSKKELLRDEKKRRKEPPVKEAAKRTGREGKGDTHVKATAMVKPVKAAPCTKAKGKPETEAQKAKRALDKKTKEDEKKAIAARRSEREKRVGASGTPRTTAEVYINKCLVPLVAQMKVLYPDGDWWLLQDGARYHNCGLVQRWLQEQHVKCIGVGGDVCGWPGNSPDLNPQENVWAISKDRAYQVTCTDLDHADKVYRSAFTTIDSSLCERLMMGMDERMTQVLLRAGKYIGK